MTQRATLGHLSIDEWIDSLTAAGASGGRTGPELGERIRCASVELDRRTALVLARCLVEGLCDHPADVRRLESLLILGLAHPRVLSKYRISLVEEGRRLAALLENQGDPVRARGVLEVLAEHVPQAREVEQDLAGVLRRSGEGGEMVERCLRRAEDAAREGRHMDAINALQEILLHDRTRRDVARMIRDLRYEQMECRQRSARRNRMAVLAMAVAGLLTTVALRERELHEEYLSLPAASAGASGDGLAERHARLGEMMVGNRLWLGGIGHRAERQALTERLQAREARLAQEASDLLIERERRQLIAEAARENGLLAIRSGELESALEHMRRSAAFAEEGWEHAPRVSADVVALEAYIEGLP